MPFEPWIEALRILIRLDVRAMVSKGAASLVERLAAGRNCPALAARRKVLALAKTKTPQITDCANLPSLVLTAKTLRAVFDYDQLVLPRDRNNGIQIGDDPE
jgi:hypothetical protein